MPRKIGLKFSETMAGSYRPLEGDGAEHSLVFHIDATSHNLWKTLRDGRVEATGYVEAEGLAERAPIEGFMVIKPLVSRFIRYEFSFTGDDGARYRYVGQKDIRHTNPLRSWTRLPGALFDADGKRIADSVLYFDVKTLPPFLRSFSPSLQSAASLR
jgi:hypothetical protein